MKATATSGSTNCNRKDNAETEGTQRMHGESCDAERFIGNGELGGEKATKTESGIGVVRD
jgi:hypothetical protein